MHQDSTRISAIIVVYNGERYLAEAIESILAQTHPPSELIVVDDGSTDGTATIARGFAEVRYQYRPNGGIGAARNLGLELARGDFIAFLDADDLWMPEKLAQQAAAFAADPQLGIVTGLIEQFHSPELDPAIAATIHCPRDPMPGHSFGAMLIRREVFSRVGPVVTGQDKAESVQPVPAGPGSRDSRPRAPGDRDPSAIARGQQQHYQQASQYGIRCGRQGVARPSSRGRRGGFESGLGRTIPGPSMSEIPTEGSYWPTRARSCCCEPPAARGPRPATPGSSGRRARSSTSSTAPRSSSSRCSTRISCARGSTGRTSADARDSIAAPGTRIRSSSTTSRTLSAR